MANGRHDDGFDIVAPLTRALLPINNLHIPKRLKRKVLQFPFTVTLNKDFAAVIKACANQRADTWINDRIIALFCELHRMRIAHSLECWHDDKLVGGLYGLQLGSTFCGESMFSLVSDASKIALVHLCARLQKSGFTLLDSQFRNPHLDQFGLYQIPQEEYLEVMTKGLSNNPSLYLEHIEEVFLVRNYIQSQNLTPSNPSD